MTVVPLPRRRASAAALLAAVSLLLPSPAAAQRVLGGGSDGVTLPRGGFRVSLSAESNVQRDRWNDGRLEGLGGAMTGPVFGPDQLSLLVPIEQTLAQLGVQDFSASLGAPRLDARQRVFVTPLAVEYGLFDWLTLGARASVVRTKAEAQFRIRTDSGRATLGMNPYFAGSGVPAANATIVAAYQTATAALNARLIACQGNPVAVPECGTSLAEAANVTQLANRSAYYGTALGSLYGAGVAAGVRWVPMAGSAADSVLRSRADSIATAFRRYGVTAALGIPTGAGVGIGAEELARIITDSTYGYGAKRLNDGGLTQVSDVTVSALVRVHDSFLSAGTSRLTATSRGWRQAVLIEGRIGTGTPPRPDRFLDQGTGTGASAITLRSITDLVLDRRFWATVAVGYTQAFAHERAMRVPSSSGSAFLEWSRLDTVRITPGGQLDLEVAPRWQLNDYVSLGAQWRWRHRTADRHDVPSTRIISILPIDPRQFPDASVLDRASAQDEQRIGVTASYSTMAARARGLPGMPFELLYQHQQSVASGGGIVPKQWEDRLTVRYYTRFFTR